MNAIIETNKSQTLPKSRKGKVEIYYPETDETIMPEGIIHYLLGVRLVSTLLAFFSEQDDVKVFGNLMFYYEEGNAKKVISPDIMLCFNLQKMPTRVYKLWTEKVVPSVIIEIASESTWDKDLTSKLAIYQRLGVSEYYIFDVEYKCLRRPLMAFRLVDFVYEEVELENNRVFSPSLNLELVDTGETLRLFNPETNEFLMTMEEMSAEIARLKQTK
jgi:Uma2 family endonuclease